MKVTDEMRDRMLFNVNVLGASGAEAGRGLGVSGRSVMVTCHVFEAVRKKDWVALREMYETAKLGLNVVEWAESRTRVKVPEALKKELAEAQQRLKEKYEAPKEPVKPEPEPKPEPPKTVAPETAPAGPKMHIPAASAETGWQTRIKVQPDKVCMTVYFNGMEVVQGWSKVKGDRELDLMQAISYAAHMCYKITEQKKLGSR